MSEEIKSSNSCKKEASTSEKVYKLEPKDKNKASEENRPKRLNSPSLILPFLKETGILVPFNANPLVSSGILNSTLLESTIKSVNENAKTFTSMFSDNFTELKPVISETIGNYNNSFLKSSDIQELIATWKSMSVFNGSDILTSKFRLDDHFLNKMHHLNFDSVFPAGLIQSFSFDDEIFSLSNYLTLKHLDKIYAILALDDDLPMNILEYNSRRLKLKGYTIDNFLANYRIGLSDTLSDDELKESVISKEKEIIRFAYDTLSLIEGYNDNLSGFFEESIKSVEQKYYIAAQALSNNILTVIRDNRIVNYRTLYNGYGKFKTINTTQDYISLIDLLSNKYNRHPKELNLVIILLQLFMHTDGLNDNHLTGMTVNRNATAHKMVGYVNQYTSLCFLLQLSEVFRLVYKIKDHNGTIIKPLAEWLY